MESELLPVHAWDSWTPIQAVRKAGRMQMSRCVCLTLFCLLSVCGEVSNSSTQQKLLQSVPTSCCLQACRGSMEHPPKTAGLCTPLQGDMEKPPHRNVGACTSDKSGRYQVKGVEELGDPGEHRVNHRTPRGTHPCRSALEKRGTQRERENEINLPSKGHPWGLILHEKVFLGQSEEKLSREIHDFIFKENTRHSRTKFRI